MRAVATAMRLRHLERLDLDAGYPEMVTRVRDLMRALDGKEQAKEADLLVDVTGTGRAVVSLLEAEGLQPIVVTITSGAGVAETSAGGWRLAKAELVSTLQVLLQTELLKMATGLPLVPTLVEELQNFKRNPTVKAAFFRE